jgi:hypothetical protein
VGQCPPFYLGKLSIILPKGHLIRRENRKHDLFHDDHLLGGGEFS